MNIVDQAAQVAASAWEMDTYENAMLTAFYQARGQEMREKKARESWTSKNKPTGIGGRGRLWHRIVQKILTLTSMKKR